MDNLVFDNSFGGFSTDGKEYVIKVSKTHKPKVAWSNVLANEKFGTVITHNLGGFTYAGNSRLNRITVWENDPVKDSPSEIIYLRDTKTNNVWTLNANVMPDDGEYILTYGFGYVNERHISNGIIQDVDIFVPIDDSIKVTIIKLKNTLPTVQNLKLIYYLKPVLGETEVKTNGYINLELDRPSNILHAQNIYGTGLSKNAYISSNRPITSYTGDSLSFIQNGNLQSPRTA